MSKDVTLARNELFAAMDSGKPYATYIKKILGQVAVTVWDNFLDKPVDVILKGDPRKQEPGCIVAVYSERENAFFKRTNLKHFKRGTIVPYELPEEKVEVSTIEQASDETLKGIINSRYMSLLAELNKIDSIPVLFRMVSLAEEMEKSNKITGAIEKRISELQVAEYPSKLDVELDVNKEEE